MFVVVVVLFVLPKLGSFVDMGYLTLTSPVNLESMESSAQGTGWIQLPDSRVCISCLQMQGTCEVCDGNIQEYYDTSGIFF